MNATSPSVSSSATRPWNAASSSAFASARAEQLLDALVVGRGQQRPEIPGDVVGGEVRGSHVPEASWRADASPPVVHHEDARREAGPLEEVLRLAIAGQRGRVDPDAPGFRAVARPAARRAAPPPRPPGPRPPRRSRRSRRAARRRAAPRSATTPYPTTCSSSVPTKIVASSRVEQRRERGLERFRTRFPRRPQRSAAFAEQLGAQLACEARRRAPGRRAVATRASSTITYAEIWSILPRIVRRLRCASRRRAPRRARRWRDRRAAPRPARPTARRSPGSATCRRPVPAWSRRSRRRSRARAAARPSGAARSRRRRCAPAARGTRFGPARGGSGDAADHFEERLRALACGADLAADALLRHRDTERRPRPGRCSSRSWCAAAPAAGGDRPRRARARRTSGAMSLMYRPAPIGAYSSTSSACSMRSLGSLMTLRLSVCGRRRVLGSPTRRSAADARTTHRAEHEPSRASSR